MKTIQWLVLHSGDKLVMKENHHVVDKESKLKFLNDNLQGQIKHYPAWLQETASHIELEIIR